MANATWHQWPTNFSNGTAITGIGSWFQYANVVTKGWIGLAILVVIWIMVLFGGMLMGVKRALASAFFVVFVFSIYFWRLGMIHPVVIILSLVGSILFAWGSKGDGGY